MAVANRMAYKDMNTIIYLAVTISLYTVIVILACFLNEIGAVIDLVGAYSISCAAFFIPSVFYTKALDKFKLKDREDPEVKSYLLMAKFFIGFGCFNAVVSLTAAMFEFFPDLA